MTKSKFALFIMLAASLCPALSYAQKAPAVRICTEMQLPSAPLTENIESSEISDSRVTPELLATRAAMEPWEYRSMVFVLEDNTEVMLYMTDAYTGKCDKGQLVFDGPAHVEVNLHNVKNIYYTDAVSTGIEEVTPDPADFCISDGKVCLANLRPGSLVRLFDIKGSLLFSETAEGDYAFDMTGWPEGVYLLNVNGSTLKFVHK